MNIDWRAAHHWLRGFSDGQLCKESHIQDHKYAEEYMRGFQAGREFCLV